MNRTGSTKSQKPKAKTLHTKEPPSEKAGGSSIYEAFDRALPGC